MYIKEESDPTSSVSFKLANKLPLQILHTVIRIPELEPSSLPYSTSFLNQVPGIAGWQIQESGLLNCLGRELRGEFQSTKQ